MNKFFIPLIVAVLAGVIIRFYDDIHIRIQEYFGKEISYRAYFGDIDINKNNQIYHYTSSDGEIMLKEAECFFETKTIARDTRKHDQPVSKPIKWKVSGYKTKDHIFFSYDPGVAYFKRNNTGEYLGYWIGQSVKQKWVKCPYVITANQAKFTSGEAKDRWKILNTKCCEYDFELDSCKSI